MNEQKIKNLIIAWRQKAFNERDPFSKFLFLWICFNAWLAFRSNKDTDADMMKWLKKQKADSSDLRASFERCASKDEFTNILKILANHSPFKRRQSEIIIRDENDFDNIIEAIYSIRCNLFHGGTDANENGFKEKITIANHILMQWISTLVIPFIQK